MTKPIIVIGAGGHAKVVIDTLKQCGMETLGAVDADAAKHGQSILGMKILGNDEVIANYQSDAVLLANGIGSTSNTIQRQEIYTRFKNQGYSFVTVVHPSSILSKDVEVGEGSQVMAGTVLQAGIRIGENCIINTRASIDHDCRIGDHVHIAPGAVLSGSVTVEHGAHVGTGASIIHEITIGERSVIGAGAAVTRSVHAGKTTTGVPAKAK